MNKMAIVCLISGVAGGYVIASSTIDIPLESQYENTSLLQLESKLERLNKEEKEIVEQVRNKYKQIRLSIDDDNSNKTE